MIDTSSFGDFHTRNGRSRLIPRLTASRHPPSPDPIQGIIRKTPSETPKFSLEKAYLSFPGIRRTVFSPSPVTLCQSFYPEFVILAERGMVQWAVVVKSDFDFTFPLSIYSSLSTSNRVYITVHHLKLLYQRDFSSSLILSSFADLNLLCSA